jgi:hypothetical protein
MCKSSTKRSRSDTLPFGPERAKILATRHCAIRANSEKLLQARQTADTGNGQTAIDQMSVAGQPGWPGC